LHGNWVFEAKRFLLLSLYTGGFCLFKETIFFLVLVRKFCVSSFLCMPINGLLTKQLWLQRLQKPICIKREQNPISCKEKSALKGVFPAHEQIRFLVPHAECRAANQIQFGRRRSKSNQLGVARWGTNQIPLFLHASGCRGVELFEQIQHANKCLLCQVKKGSRRSNRLCLWHAQRLCSGQRHIHAAFVRETTLI